MASMNPDSTSTSTSESTSASTSILPSALSPSPPPSSPPPAPSPSSASSEEKEAFILQWYSSLHPYTVDLVGDIAGREPFIIHGESLLRYCLQESYVDFKDGFQILHAVYAVERFLGNLHKRGCDFDIVFFRQLRHLSVPSSGENTSKHQLMRMVIINHLQRHARRCAQAGARAAVLEFESPRDEAFVRYLEPLPIHFILCHAGGEEDDRDAVQLRSMIFNFVSRGKNVAVLNSIQWRSSKVYAPLIGRSSVRLPFLSVEETFDSLHTPLFKSADVPPQFSIDLPGLSVRELLAIASCRFLIASAADEKPSSGENLIEMIQAYLLHLAVLKNCTLLERQAWMDTSNSGLAPEDAGVLTQITEATLFLINEHKGLLGTLEEADWDLYDLMDGFVFAFVLGKLRKQESLPWKVSESWKELWSAFSSVTHCESFPDLQKIKVSGEMDFSSTAPTATIASALPFSHAVLNEFLGGISLKERKEKQDEAADLVFRDLHHWHSAKPLDPALQRRKPGFFARKRNQELLADIVTYSASLTNARGKLINPEIVVVKRGAPPITRRGLPSSDKAEPKAKEKKEPKNGKKGGKADALKAAQQVQERKEVAKRVNVVANWSSTCSGIQKDTDLVNQYLKTRKFFFDRSRVDLQIIGPDIQLYLIQILANIWGSMSSRATSSARTGLYLISLMWHGLQQLSLMPASKAVVQTSQELLNFLNMPVLPMSTGSLGHELCFKFDFKPIKGVPKLIGDTRAFQLEHGGPFMERRFDSQPDDRVPFDPDAWQRKVLDSIDADNSLLVLAPTSAGKTFISFYAMKKVLEESDDGVLVYVAPTKALVNQIAAEIGARFSKSYQQPGKSVWAIYTRDYRVQSSTGCQILVTVPHILQIMLLAPENAKKANSWSRRIRRIIFDEVHCIGQAEDGVVWEQLLLMAPCPIIALSATVGNPIEFRDWLSMVQERKGLKLDMVVHTSRYSDLRKFIYKPEDTKPFTGFNWEKKISVPGLDEGNESCSRFCFVHPIAALTDRNRFALDDLSLEPRDCLKLLDIMKQVLPATEMAKLNLPDLKTLPAVITKSDVARWGVQLKDALRKIMEAQGTKFYEICDLLKPVLKNHRKDLFIGNSYEKKASSLFNLIRDLHDRDSLPVLVFHYDMYGCEAAIQVLLEKLESAEEKWKANSPEWKQKMDRFEQWSRTKLDSIKANAPSRSKDKNGDASKSAGSKLEQMREDASVERSPWEIFDPDAPLEQFSLADITKLLPSEVEGFIKPLRGLVWGWMLDALRRGLGIHHSGLNRQYRQTVEIMFRTGYLRVVVATGTLALGINMPCKTVVFHGDSIFLTAQGYQQASGRAGRRGFDLLGNVVFHGIPRDRVFEIISARIPGLTGQFPISTTLVLRLLTLLHGSENSTFATTMVQSLLSQTRLYLGGPEAALSVKHHLRFSIEYLRRHRLLRSDGTPINFAGLVGHLYFTENNVFAFHSLLKGGYFHQICAQLDRNPERVLLQMVLVLCHIFNRVPILRRQILAEKSHRSPSMIFLPRLPQRAETLLIEHNEETLSIFQDYVQSYISDSLADIRDRTLPYTRTMVGQEEPSGGGLCSETSHVVRSPFVALSGLKDDFKSIHELCETVRSDVFLEESAIPYIPVWPHDSQVELNAYIYDFWKHGSMEVLVRDNGIKRGDVWFRLQDFSRTLSTIVTSIATLMGGDQAGVDATNDGSDCEFNPEEDGQARFLNPGPQQASKPKAKTPVVDDWQDGEDGDSGEDDESRASSDENEESSDQSVPGCQGEGDLRMVLKAFTMLRDQFVEKFRITWA